jgi:small subunit ribosomal protein S9
MEKVQNTVGRRKSAVVRVFLSKGTGAITVNGKDYKTYFPMVYLQNQVEKPLQISNSLDKFNINVNATGGGLKGQAEATKLGIARALCLVDTELRPPLKKEGMLKRNSKRVERKKPGRRKARRKSQFSKR